MTTYKVYFRHQSTLTHAYFEASSIELVKWKVLARFYGASIQSIVVVS